MQNIINLINQFIVANNNKEITANVLNPILVAMVEQPNELIGALEQSSVQGATIVDKLNTLLDLFNTYNGVVVHVGTENPNTTPPTSYKTADFYQQVVNSNVIGLYIYTGYEWVLIHNVIADNIISLNNTWSSFKINEMLNNSNGIINLSEILINGNTVTVTNGMQWRINGVVYTNNTDIDLTVPFTSHSFFRLDNIVANTSGGFELQQGTPTQGIALAPLLEPNKVLITTLYVSDNEIKPDLPNFDLFKQKSENASFVNSESGEINLQFNSNNSHAIITNATKINSIVFGSDSQLYIGKIFKITNNTTHFITLKNNLNLKFILDRDYYLLPGETVEFYLSENLNTLVFLGTNRPIENSITINTNTTLTNAHHGATLYVLANVTLTFSAPSVLVPDFEVAIKTHTAGVANIVTTGWVVSAPDGKKLDVNTMGFIGRIPSTDTLSFGGAFSV